ncbi:MAG: nucleoside-diphosphate sugar epimerase/dehydratase, partial [Candidatus Omnitrophota bacterium]
MPRTAIAPRRAPWLMFILDFRRPLIITLHLFLVVAAFFTAFLLRFDFNISAEDLRTLSVALMILIPVKMGVLCVAGLNAGMWKFVDTQDLWNILKANMLATMIFVLVYGFFFRFMGFPRSVVIIDLILCVMLMSGVRFAVRFYREFRMHFTHEKRRDHNILIVGAGEAGAILLKEINRNPRMGRVVAFVDDDRSKIKETINGVKIMGKRQDIPRLVDDLKVDEIILAIPSAKGEAVRGVLAYCERTDAKIRVVPGLDKIISGEMELRAREVRPEDLLGREAVYTQTEDIFRYIKGRVVLVTGAGGSIGSEIARQVASFEPKEILLFDHYENSLYFLLLELRDKYPSLSVRSIVGDIRDVGLLIHVFTRTHPQVVFHAAAHKHVPLMEDSPVAAVKNNVFGTRNMIYASHHYAVERFVMISTDKAVNPSNIMGMSKRVAEMILQARAVRSKTRFMAVRFGNVLGSAGSVVPLFKAQIEAGGPITITHPDVKRYFMSIKEACMLVLQAGALGDGGELFILDMGEQIKVMDLAKNLIAFSGLKLGHDIDIKFTGLRPGEKLEEELLLDKEQDAVTCHNKIFMSHSGVKFNRAVLHRDLRHLHAAARGMDEL